MFPSHDPAAEKLRILNGGGITFNGDTSTANALDDYEEGTFTATCANSVQLYSNQDTCGYVKVGNVVTVGGQLRVSNDASNANFYLNNLPFTCKSQTEDADVAIGAVRTWDWNLPDSSKGIICMTYGGSNNLQFWSNNDSGNAVFLSAAVNSYIAFTITYFTA